MRYFKNIELAKLYAISEGTVRRWIDASQNSKLDLQLFEHDGMSSIANTTKNLQMVEDLVAKGKKSSNVRWRKSVTPAAEFYDLYNDDQICDIISNLEIHHEIPRQYNYFDGEFLD